MIQLPIVTTTRPINAARTQLKLPLVSRPLTPALFVGVVVGAEEVVAEDFDSEEVVAEEVDSEVVAEEVDSEEVDELVLEALAGPKLPP